MKERDAYLAIFRFLDERYRRLPSDQLGALLGEMQLASDGEPFDPAIAEEWNRAVTAGQGTTASRVLEQHRRAS